MSLTKSFDVNAKFDPTNITPEWDVYVYVPGGTEMLFNRTKAGAPVVEPIGTDPVVLQRCACVFYPSLSFSFFTNDVAVLDPRLLHIQVLVVGYG